MPHPCHSPAGPRIGGQDRVEESILPQAGGGSRGLLAVPGRSITPSASTQGRWLQGLDLGIGAQVAQALHDNIGMGKRAARLASWKIFWLALGLTAAVILVLFPSFFRGRRTA